MRNGHHGMTRNIGNASFILGDISASQCYDYLSDRKICGIGVDVSLIV